MGTVAGVQCFGQADGLFVDQMVQECVKAFTTIPESRSDFVKFLKDGFWGDYLFQTELLHARNHRERVANFEVGFTTYQRRVSLDGNLRTSTSNSSKTAGVSPELVGSFDEMYTNVERRTCFTHESMQAFLFAIVCPLYLQNCKEYSKLVHGEPNYQDSDVPSDLGDEESEMIRLQEILLASAAYSDELELDCALSTPLWLHTLTTAINDSFLAIIIYRVDHNVTTNEPPTYHPVVVNAAAHKRSSYLRRSLSQREGDLFDLWSVDTDAATRAAMNECLSKAQPIRLFAKDRKTLRPTTPVPGALPAPSASGTNNNSGTTTPTNLEPQAQPQSPPPLRGLGVKGASGSLTPPAPTPTTAVLDITHVFDSQGVHRYVLGVMADGVDKRNLDKEVRNLADSALLLSHVIKPPATESAKDNAAQSYAMALLRAKSKRDLC